MTNEHLRHFRNIMITLSLITVILIPIEAHSRRDASTFIDEKPLGRAPVTTITVTDEIIRGDVNRLGINIAGRSRWGESLTALKNLLSNPGFEPSYFSSNILLRSDGSNSTAVMQDFWEESWNDDAGGTGQPDGFWNDGEYEFVYGGAKGHNGTIVDFNYTEDGPGTSRPTFKLDHPVPAVADHDVMIVRKKFDSNYLLSINASPAGPWSVGGDGDIYFDESENRPGTPGEQSMRIGRDTRLAYYMDTYYRDGDVTCGKGVIVKGDWNISLWARAEDPGDRVHVELFREGVWPPFASRTFTLSTDWRRYTVNFTVPEGLDPDKDYTQGDFRGALDLIVESRNRGNGGRIWLDDAHFGRRNHTNPTIFSDVVVSRLRQLDPGILRGWYGQLGISLEEFTDPSAGRRNQGYRIGSRKAGPLSYSMHEFFELAREVNSSVWLVLPPILSPEELSDIIDYIAGPVSTQYGAKRAALGQHEPWTDVFDMVRLEFGNELWGAGTSSDPFGGASLNGGVRLGSIAGDRFALMRQNPHFDPDRIKLVIGGQSGYSGRQAEIEASSEAHDCTALAPYYYGSIPNHTSTEEIFGALYALPTEYAARGAFREGVDNIVSGGHDTEPAIYEINFHTTHGTDPPERTRNDVVAGQGGGISLSYTMLTYLKHLGIRDQAAFSSWQYSYRYSTDPSEYVKLWGMLRDLDRTRNRRPTWLSVEVANKAMFGDMVRTVHSDDEPRWVQQPVNGISEQMSVSYVQSFSFREDGNGSIILYNLHRTYGQEVRLDIEINPGSRAERYVLASSDIYDHNEGTNENVTITGDVLDDFSHNTTLTLPPHSITVLTWRDNLPPEADFTYGPASPDVDELVSFTSFFSDDDGHVDNWTWDFGDGSGQTHDRNATHRYADHGNHTVTLRVRDDGGTAISIEKNITVRNAPPVCLAMEDVEDYEDRYLLFSGHGNDTPSDRYGLLYRWDFGDGNYTSWQENAMAGHNYAQQGAYGATLTVIDDGGLQDSDTVNVTIINHPPGVTIEPRLNKSILLEDEIMRFSGTGDDSPSDLHSLRYRWDFGDGNVSSWKTDGDGNHSYSRSGQYRARLRVRDNDNSTVEASIDILVENVPPSGSFTPGNSWYWEDEEIVMEAVDVRDTPSDLPSLNLTWLADGAPIGFGGNVSFTVARSGLYLLSLNITDDDEAFSNSSHPLHIQNALPKAVFTVSALEIAEGESVLLDAGNTTDTRSDMESLNYTWTSLGSHLGYGRRIEQRFSKKGTYPVMLTVIDDDGGSDTNQVVITVVEMNSSADVGTREKGIGASTWYLIIFITAVAALLVVGIMLFHYNRKREGRRAPKISSDGPMVAGVGERRRKKKEMHDKFKVEAETETEVEGRVETKVAEGWIEDEDEHELPGVWVEADDKDDWLEDGDEDKDEEGDEDESREEHEWIDAGDDYEEDEWLDAGDEYGGEDEWLDSGDECEEEWDPEEGEGEDVNKDEGYDGDEWLEDWEEEWVEDDGAEWFEITEVEEWTADEYVEEWNMEEWVEEK